MAACDTVGDSPVIDSAAASADAPASPSSFEITVAPSSPQASDTVSFTLAAPSSHDISEAAPIWVLDDGELLGTGTTVEHVFDVAGEYHLSVLGLPDEVNVERVVPVAGQSTTDAQ